MFYYKVIIQQNMLCILFSDELAKQLLQSSAKAVITQLDTYPTVLLANQLNLRPSDLPVILVKDKVC